METAQMTQKPPEATGPDGGQGGNSFPRLSEHAGDHAICARSGVEIRSYYFEPTSEGLQYVLFVPSEWDRSLPAPLIVALRPSGVPPQLLLNLLAPAAEHHRFVIVAPAGYSAKGWFGSIRRNADPVECELSRLSEIDVMSVLHLVQSEFNIDERRIYIVGASIGGNGAVHLAAKFRNLFAAIAVVSPAITSTLPEEFVSFDAAPLLVVHGDEDAAVPVRFVRKWVALLEGRQISVAYHEVMGGNHISVMHQTGGQVLEFLARHSRIEVSPSV
jgi:predicted peptidase